MNCIKTGAVVYISDYKSRYICDVFQSENLLIFRIAKRIQQERYNHHPVDYEVSEQIAFFDKDVMSETQNATLITKSENTRFIREA